MIKQKFVLICESTIVDKDTNTLSVFSMFENISTNKLPLSYPKFCVVTNFEGGVGEHSHKILISHESGDEIAKLEGKINFASNPRAQYIGNFIGISLPKFGKYAVEIYVDNILQPLSSSFSVTEKN